MTDETPDIQVGQNALRTFKVDFRKKELLSITQSGSHWKGGVCTAVCLAATRRPHRVPDSYCVCGIYGTLSLTELRQFGPTCIQDIVTVIAAEGHTIIGPRGLRTERARVIAYWTPVRTIRQIAAKQFEGAQHYNNLQTMLDDHDLPAGGPLPKRRSSVLSAMLTAVWSLLAAQTAVSGALYIQNGNYGWAALQAFTTGLAINLALYNYRQMRQRMG